MLLTVNKQQQGTRSTGCAGLHELFSRQMITNNNQAINTAVQQAGGTSATLPPKVLVCRVQSGDCRYKTCHRSDSLTAFKRKWSEMIAILCFTQVGRCEPTEHTSSPLPQREINRKQTKKNQLKSVPKKTKRGVRPQGEKNRAGCDMIIMIKQTRQRWSNSYEVGEAAVHDFTHTLKANTQSVPHHGGRSCKHHGMNL